MGMRNGTWTPSLKYKVPSPCSHPFSPLQPHRQLPILWCVCSHLPFQENALEAQRGGVTGPASPSQGLLVSESGLGQRSSAQLPVPPPHLSPHPSFESHSLAPPTSPLSLVPGSSVTTQIKTIVSGSPAAPASSPLHGSPGSNPVFYGPPTAGNMITLKHKCISPQPCFVMLPLLVSQWDLSPTPAAPAPLTSSHFAGRTPLFPASGSFRLLLVS